MEPAERDRIQRWLSLLADGDRSAFQPLFEALWPLLRSFARRLIADPAEAEDAAQQSLLMVFRRASTFRPDRDALSWILAVTANECRRRLRARARRGISLPGDADLGRLFDSGPSPEESAVRGDLLDAAARMVSELPPRDAEVLVASILGETSLRPAIAAPAYRKRLERALHRLRAAWRRRHG